MLHKKYQQIALKMPIQNLVQKIGEEYTSGVSSIDKEEINRKFYNKTRRIKRGLFKTNRGKIVDLRLNGNINILRKYKRNL